MRKWRPLHGSKRLGSGTIQRYVISTVAWMLACSYHLDQFVSTELVTIHSNLPQRRCKRAPAVLSSQEAPAIPPHDEQ